MTEIDVKMIRRHAISRALRPFDNDDSTLAHEIVPSDVRELRLIVETIQIDVIHRRLLSFVFMNECVCGTGDRLLNSITGADCLSESCLSRTKIARKGNDKRRHDCFAKLAPPVDHLAFGEIEVTLCRKRRNNVPMSLH